LSAAAESSCSLDAVSRYTRRQLLAFGYPAFALSAFPKKSEYPACAGLFGDPVKNKLHFFRPRPPRRTTRIRLPHAHGKCFPKKSTIFRGPLLLEPPSIPLTKGDKSL